MDKTGYKHMTKSNKWSR